MIKTQPATTSGKSDGLHKEARKHLPLERRNFLYMAIAGALIVLGFLLMLGGSSTMESFNPDIFSTRRIVIGPLVTFAGFIFMGVALAISPKSNDTDTNKDN